jgi:mono/diheme cytochrome c family protein
MAARIRALCFTALAATALLWTLPGVSSAQGLSAAGKARFERYCSSCHGLNAKGDGPVANLLTKRPADLTQLAKANGGKFPGIKVMREIDGRDTVRAHGTSDMPVWGQSFKAANPATANVGESATRGTVQEIVAYLQSIQEK